MAYNILIFLGPLWGYRPMRAASFELVDTPAGEDRGLRRFLASSLAVHVVGIALLAGILAHLSVPVERPLRVQIVNAPPALPAAPAGPPVQAAPATPGAAPAPAPGGPPELVEAPKPSVEQAPRTKRFAGLYDRRGGPGARNAPDADTRGKSAPRVERETLRGEEIVRPPALPPREAAPAKAPAVQTPAGTPAPAQDTNVARADPLSPGRTTLLPPPAPTKTSPALPGPAPGGSPTPRPWRSLRDQVAGLGTDYRPPVEDPGTGGDPTGRGEPGLETFRFKYATWGLAVKRDIERAWRVPGYGITSLSIVRFVVLPDGKIRDLQLEKSSGLASLDQAATNAISNAAPFRPFPPRMREENPGGIDITVNFYYREGRGVLHWE